MVVVEQNLAQYLHSLSQMLMCVVGAGMLEWHQFVCS